MWTLEPGPTKGQLQGGSDGSTRCGGRNRTSTLAGDRTRISRGTTAQKQIELEEVIHADEGCVVTAVRDGGRLKESDSEVWSHFFHVWTFRDGRILRRSSHVDRARP